MSRPRPVVSTAGVVGVVHSVALVAGWLGFANAETKISAASQAVGALVVAIVTLAAHLGAAVHAEAKVTPNSDPRDELGQRLKPVAGLVGEGSSVLADLVNLVQALKAPTQPQSVARIWGGGGGGGGGSASVAITSPQSNPVDGAADPGADAGPNPVDEAADPGADAEPDTVEEPAEDAAEPEGDGTSHGGASLRDPAMAATFAGSGDSSFVTNIPPELQFYPTGLPAMTYGAFQASASATVTPPAEQEDQGRHAAP